MTGQHESTDAEDLVFGQRVKVVLLRHTDSQIIPLLGSTPVDLTSDELGGGLLAELVESATTLDSPAGVPEETVRALRLAPVPSVFTRSPWLHEHRVLTFTDAGVPVGGHTLHYHEKFGVYAEEDA